MTPDLEVVRIGVAESFKAWEHGYPFHSVHWHFHPEYELHYVADTAGRYFVGDFIGVFEPGNLVLTGPNLPHNWVSELGPGEAVGVRSRGVHFTEGFVAEAMRLMPELAPFRSTLERSRSGLAFGAATAGLVGPMLERLVRARGIRRIEIFMAVIGALSRAPDARTLASASYLPDPSGFMAAGINEALAFINDNLTGSFALADVARAGGMSPATFSRRFRRHTGLTLVQFVNRLRLDLACQMLMRDPAVRIGEVCFSSGFNNVSNFNRQFLAHKGMTPTQFRALLGENGAAPAALAGAGMWRGSKRAAMEACPCEGCRPAEAAGAE